MKVIRRNFGQGSGTQEQKLRDDELLLDRLIYRKIGSLTDNKLLVTPDSSDTEFHRWLLDMNNLHNKRNYPLISAGDPEPTPDLVALDEYLATLGQTEKYPFPQDTYNVESWLEIDDPEPERVIVDTSDNTYLTDSNGTEVLIYIAGA